MRYMILAGLLELAGCTTSLYSWQRPDGTADAFYVEQGQCEAQSYTISRPLIGQTDAAFNACMRGKGWRGLEWRGPAAGRFPQDDYSCRRSGSTGPDRGPAWADCMRRRGWQPES